MLRTTPQESRPRRLIHFPIIHNQADMGALGESVRLASLKKVGRAAWNRKVGLIDKLWTEIEKSVDQLSVPLEQVRIYQDGLPVSGKEEDLVAELAKTGSRNHALIQRLVRKGAIIMGTESLELLLEEYELAKQGLGSGKPPSAKRRHASAGTSLLTKRDQFIARRINETLLPGETGVIFLGMLHSVEPWLDKDIEVIYPIHRPVERG
jgi:hypothetical protein